MVIVVRHRIMMTGAPHRAGATGLNGDILVWNPVLEDAFDFLPQGIRVVPTR